MTGLSEDPDEIGEADKEVIKVLDAAGYAECRNIEGWREINVMNNTVHPAEIFPCHMTDALCQHLKAGSGGHRRRQRIVGDWEVLSV
ncbi:hypothetical protein E2C01_096623 [Portunus trituberculatus]|uniref:Uncharacterized protein n=1 Tax=Portunus trituberculatus TaxID=210409 RepID=A0A5B7K283_PORTR|nr:hypothetical protein [Portunus trituberculatus]